MTEELKCTHCKKKLGSRYTFSYGVPGVVRKYGCDRFVCKKKRAVLKKVKNKVWFVADKMKKTSEKLLAWVYR